MSSNNKILLNTFLGVVLAVVLVLGLAAMNANIQSKSNIQLTTSTEGPSPKFNDSFVGSSPAMKTTSTEDQTPKINDTNSVRSPTIKVTSTEEQVLGVDNVSVSNTTNLLEAGIPFVIALLAGVIVFTIVRRKLQ